MDFGAGPVTFTRAVHIEVILTRFMRSAGCPIGARAAILVLTLFAGACRDARGQASLADELVSAAARHQARVEASAKEVEDFQRRVETLASGLRSAEADLSGVRAAKPVLQSKESALQIGEFETEDEFRKRQAVAKQVDQDRFNASERDWRNRISAKEREVERLRRSIEARTAGLRDEAERLGERSLASVWEVPALPAFRRTLGCKDFALPKFDRSSMSFGPVTIPASGISELRSSLPGNLVARIEETSTAAIRITLPSLDAAKAFREGFESGSIVCVVQCGLDLGPAGPESPILVKPEVARYEETTDIGAVARAVGTTLYGLVSGAHPDDVSRALESQAPANPNLVRVVEQPAVLEAGTRYHFTMSPETVSFMDTSQRATDGAAVSFVGDFPRVKVVRANAPPESRVLQQGDRIVRVGDRETRDARAVRAACRAVPPGKDFVVTYRRAGSVRDLTFGAVGGRPLGIEFE